MPLDHLEHRPDAERETARLIQSLIGQPESERLDFKAKHYWDHNREKGNADLLKDLLAFANTPRRDPAYVVLGVKQRPGAVCDITGIDQSYDDAAIKGLVRDKTSHPIAFGYTEAEFEGKRVGLLTIDAEQEQPIVLRQDLKNSRQVLIPAGQILERDGSRNSVAMPGDYCRKIQVIRDGVAPNLVQMAKRWLEVFEVHDVNRSQIPDLFPEHRLRYQDLATYHSVVEILTPELKRETCGLFHVSESYLSGDDDHVQELLHYGRGEASYLRHLVRQKAAQCEICVHCFTDTEQPEPGADWRCAIVAVTSLKHYKTKVVEAFAPFYKSLNAGNRRIAFDLLEMAIHLEIPVYSGVLPANTLVEVATGEGFTRVTLDRANRAWRRCTWHPEQLVADRRSHEVEPMAAAIREDIAWAEYALRSGEFSGGPPLEVH